mgnify:CR=1 FL=1
MPRGKRVQIYLPADLLEQWGKTPRYERSAEVAKALRAWWAARKDTFQTEPSRKNTERNTKGIVGGDEGSDIPQ